MSKAHKKQGMTFTRLDFFNLIWSKPLTDIGEQFGVSGNAIAKVCAQNDMPVPGRGYWQMSKDLQQKSRATLPLRPPGKRDMIDVCGGSRKDDDDYPLPPVFDETLEELRQRILPLVDKLPVKIKDGRHTVAIQRYLDKDLELLAADKKHSVSFASIWGPYFQLSHQRRRLEVLNWLQWNAPILGCKLEIRGKQAQNVTLTVGDMPIHIDIDFVAGKQPKHALANENFSRANLDKLKLTAKIAHWDSLAKIAFDEESGLLTGRLKEIFLDLLVYGESAHRHLAAQSHKWRIEQIEYQREERKKRAIEDREAAARQNEETKRKNIAKLLEQASQFRMARDIRDFVNTLRASGIELELDAWAEWALKQADQIDPTLNGSLKESVSLYREEPCIPPKVN